MNTETLLTPSQAEAKEDHGHQQAKAQAESLVDMVCALTCDYDRLQELRDEREELAEAVTEAEATHAEACRSYSSSTREQNTMREAVAALTLWDEENAEELKDLEDQAGDCTDQEDAQQRIQEDRSA
jgi:septal ring factor EnvC (AmiA/AmiB activator)